MATTSVQQALAADRPDRATYLLELSEDQWFDRKSNRINAKDLADAVIGMANAEGGTLVVGLHNGAIEPAPSAKAINAFRQLALDFTTPPVPMRLREVECEDEGQVVPLVIIDIEASETVHHNSKEEVFLRSGDENRKLTFSQHQELLYDKGQAFYEVRTMSAALDELDQSLIESYASAVHAASPAGLLQARGLTTAKGAMTVGAMLLFGTNPTEYFPEAHVRVLRYQGTERSTGSRQQIIFDQRYEGSIPFILLAADAAISEAIPKRKALTGAGRFESVGIVPRDAWLEGLVNAVVHRSYSNGGDHIRVDIFDDRVEIESPGRFPGLVDPGNPLAIKRFARNPRIARVCADLNFGQELGEGVRRIFDEMRLAGLADPVYRQTAGSVQLTLRAIAVDRFLESRLPDGSRELVRLIREQARLSTGQLVELTGRSRPNVIKMLKVLQTEGLIGWSGKGPSDPRAYWHLKVD